MSKGLHPFLLFSMLPCLLAAPTRAETSPVGPYLNAGVPMLASLQVGIPGQLCSTCSAGYAVSGESGLGGGKVDLLLTVGAVGQRGYSYNIWGVGPVYMYPWGYPAAFTEKFRHHAGGELTLNLLDFDDSQGTEMVKFAAGYLTTVDDGDRGHIVLLTAGINLRLIAAVVAYRPMTLGP